MLQNRFTRLPHVCLALLTIALASTAVVCTHPKQTGGTGSGTGTGTGTGGSSGTGSGGSSSTGTGGSGSGGTGEIEIPPDGGAAGTGGAPAKAACADDPNQQHALPYTPGYVIDNAAKTAAMSTVSAMSLPQKADQLRGPNMGGYEDIFRTADVGGVKGFEFRDGPRGVNLDAVKKSGQQGYSTVFPVAIARGAAFDVDLEYQIGQAIGDEMVASRSTMMLAPTVNILRHPAWGRAQETYGEDSFQLGRLGTAFTVGVQEYVPACAKHYAANNIERDRKNANALMDDQTLRDVYARHFGMIIQDGGVSCIMAAYNSVQVTGGQPKKSTQNALLLNTILRTEFGFQGMVLSDWWAMPGDQMPREEEKLSIATEALNAGLDMELPWNLNYKYLENISNGEPIVTKSALRVITEKFRFKVAAPGPTATIGLKAPTTIASNGSITNNDAHIALAQKAAVEGTVLLKNDNGTLPIKTTAKNVAVIGPAVNWQLMGVNAGGTINFATDARIGDLGSSRVNAEPAKTKGPFAGIQAEAPSGVTVVSGNGDNADTEAKVRAADFVVIVAGLTPQDEGEEYTITPQDADRGGNMGLDGKTGGTAQNAFITKYAGIAATGGKPVVVVLEGGSAITLPWLSMVPALVMAWYPGQAGGSALGQLLFGKVNFSGKLPLSWPSAIADEPTFSGPGTTTMMGYNLGYRWFDAQNKTPLFPFGHGMSYTTFEYSNLSVPCSTATAKSVVNVTVDVKNTGMVAGDEVVFLFVSYPGTTVPNRGAATYKELKGFRRVSLTAGQTKRITIPIRVSDLNYFDTTSKSWKVAPGMVKVMVGPDASASKLTLSDTFTVQ